MGHSAGAHATLEMLDGMLDSFGQGLSRAAQSKTRQREQSCTLLGEMLDSFD